MNSPYIANTDSLTLHIRLTKKCNADCSYCSSYEDSHFIMSLDDAQSSFLFLKKLILEKKLGGKRKMLTVQYVGGELTTLNTQYLLKFTELVKNILSPLFENFKHGAQTNLIASHQNINSIFEIFDKNIGTSIDNFTQQRTIKNSSSKYKTIFLKNMNYVKRNLGLTLPGIIVLDQKMKPFIYEEIKIAEKNKNNITLRPVFQGSLSIENIKLEELVNIYSQIFDNWFMNSSIIIDPLHSLLKKRIASTSLSPSLSSYSGCPFQNNCVTSSINVEPNGDLYICLDMADSKNYVYGNSITGIINDDVFDLLAKRSQKLNTDCIQCEYYKECQGGCMNEAIEHTHDVFGKTQYCIIWKTLFKKIDQKIQLLGIPTIEKWLDSLKE